MARVCQNKRKNQYRLDNLDKFHKLERQERVRNYAGRKDKADIRRKQRYYSNNLKDVIALMYQHANSRAKSASLEFNIDKAFLAELFRLQNNRCALTGIEFRYGEEVNGSLHKRPFAPSLDRIDCKSGYIIGNVRVVCVIVNFALCEFGDKPFDEMCEARINYKDSVAKNA